MNSLQNKILKKGKSIKVYFLSHDRKIYIYHLIPEDDTLRLVHNKVTQRYKFDSTKVFLTSAGFDKHKPTVYLVEGNAEAIDPFTLKNSYDAELFEVAMSNNLVKDIVRASETKKLGLDDILSYITLGLLVLIFFYLYQMNSYLKPERPDTHNVISEVITDGEY